MWSPPPPFPKKKYMAQEKAPIVNVSPEYVEAFEADQKEYGTKTAISNLLFLIASEIMSKADVKNTKVEYKTDFVISGNELKKILRRNDNNRNT